MFLKPFWFRLPVAGAELGKSLLAYWEAMEWLGLFNFLMLSAEAS